MRSLKKVSPIQIVGQSNFPKFARGYIRSSPSLEKVNLGVFDFEKKKAPLRAPLLVFSFSIQITDS